MGFTSMATQRRNQAAERSEEMRRARGRYGELLRQGWDADQTEMAAAARCVYPSKTDRELADQMVADLEAAPAIFEEAARLAEHAAQEPGLRERAAALERKLKETEDEVLTKHERECQAVYRVREQFMEARREGGAAQSAGLALKHLRAAHPELFADEE